MTHTKSQPSLKGHARPRSRRNSQATPPKTSARKQVTSVKLPLSRQTVLTFSNNQRSPSKESFPIFTGNYLWNTWYKWPNSFVGFVVSFFFRGWGEPTNQPKISTTNQGNTSPVFIPFLMTASQGFILPTAAESVCLYMLSDKHA